jgi:hypothetical protein
VCVCVLKRYYANEYIYIPSISSSSNCVSSNVSIFHKKFKFLKKITSLKNNIYTSIHLYIYTSIQSIHLYIYTSIHQRIVYCKKKKSKTMWILFFPYSPLLVSRRERERGYTPCLLRFKDIGREREGVNRYRYI